ncbi:hypothetical protein V2H45_22415 [Tumidithrix elongata RA019]|uniref:Rhs family protein n=1 Tax=Tumidithrix elongata BACA0141 TaxID=2716417 RepID=A0AAW9PYI4_9CYAN|nr:hypothetical protein [Tumidithrix elongata RA019]
MRFTNNQFNGSSSTTTGKFIHVNTIDPLGQRTQYGYDLKNRRNTVTDALGKVTTTTFDAFGNVLSITDPANNKTSYEYSVKQLGKKIATNGTIPSISYDGRYVALGIDTSLDIKDTNNLSDVFRNWRIDKGKYHSKWRCPERI